MSVADEKDVQAPNRLLISEFNKLLGAELRSLRKRSDMSQEEAGQLLGWTSRSTFGKVEQGEHAISLLDYLTVLHHLREADNDHPGLALADHLLPRLRSRMKRIQSAAFPAARD